MTTYILRRLIQTILVTVILSYVCFDLMNRMPGDRVSDMIAANPRMTPEDAARLRTLYNLDQPVYKRYLLWAGDIVRGDFGYSQTYRIPVREILGPKLKNTVVLSLAALLFSLLVSIPLGVFSALRPGTKIDYVVNMVSFGGISIPSFWLGIVLILIFSVWLPVLPAGGTQTIGTENTLGFWADLLDRSKYLILPVLSLSLQQIGRFARFTRSAMLESMRNDFIRTAKAKGMSRQVVIWRHAFRNALIPLITVLALSISSVFSGAIITETVFAYQGVGKLTYDSIIGNDYNVAMISFIISIAMVLIMNLVADILYGVADPRISYS
jgi:peptide/nickel transport system permease protein